VANLAFFQNRLGRTDGVSLEVDKWRVVLRDRLGHRVLYCSGNDDVPGNVVIPELYAQHPTTWKILQNATVAFRDYPSEAALEREIYAHADVIERRLLEVMAREQIQLLLPNNLCSGGYQPAAAIAFHRVLRRTGVPAIVHSHDFYFEESGEVRATCQTVASIYERYFPPKLPNVTHVVINRLAQTELKTRKNLSATVVPNVFDFDQPTWVKDDYNHDLRESFGIGPDDLVALQATRILDRKGIELAIDLLARLNQPEFRHQLMGTRTVAGGTLGPHSRLILLCAGIVEQIGISGGYWPALQARAARLGVDLRHVGERVKHSRGGASAAGGKVYSLWDTYVHADFVTYPSTWEGWGNQFIEAVFARLPVVLFEYPVWRSDLGPVGFEVISLGADAKKGEDGLVAIAPERLATAALELIAVLRDPGRRAAMTERNAQLAREHFSLDSLQSIIAPLVDAALEGRQ
jgi:mannosylglucosylglycerate synthase